MTMHTETINGITYTLSIRPEDIPVRGNAMDPLLAQRVKALQSAVNAAIERITI
jgi:hypothetical protein